MYRLARLIEIDAARLLERARRRCSRTRSPRLLFVGGVADRRLSDAARRTASNEEHRADYDEHYAEQKAGSLAPVRRIDSQPEDRERRRREQEEADAEPGDEAEKEESARGDPRVEPEPATPGAQATLAAHRHQVERSREHDQVENDHLNTLDE